jgi:hypothetical protein
MFYNNPLANVSQVNGTGNILYRVPDGLTVSDRVADVVMSSM